MAETKKEKDTNKIEREYVIPLREKIRVVARYKKTNKAVKTIKEFLVRHMKIYDRDLNKIKIDKYLNEFLWHRGIRNPPHKIKVKVIKELDAGIIKVELAEMPEKLKFKKAREEKREIKAQESLKKKPKIAPEKEAGQPKEKETEKTEEEKKEEQEKKAAVVESEKMLEKELAKKQKHTTQTLSPKQEKDQRVGYNKSSRGR